MGHDIIKYQVKTCDAEVIPSARLTENGEQLRAPGKCVRRPDLVRLKWSAEGVGEHCFIISRDVVRVKDGRCVGISAERILFCENQVRWYRR